jgi:hypothetical protein
LRYIRCGEEQIFAAGGAAAVLLETPRAVKANDCHPYNTQQIVKFEFNLKDNIISSEE